MPRAPRNRPVTGEDGGRRGRSLPPRGSCSIMRWSSTRRQFKAGQTVWVRAVAQDRRQLDLPELKLGPQESATPWQQIHIVASETKAKADMAQLEACTPRWRRSFRTSSAPGRRHRAAQAQTRGRGRQGCRRRPRPAGGRSESHVRPSIAVDRPDRRSRSAHDQARGEQAGLRRDGPGHPPGRGRCEQVETVAELAKPVANCWPPRTRSSTSCAGCWARSARKPPSCSPR